MTKIGSLNGASFQGAGGGMQTGNLGMQSDSVSRNIRDQIANAQKQLQEISANQEMTPEEKMKKRQEIQQEITNLNQQLRQRQIEQRKEQQAKGASADDMSGGKQGTGKTKQENNKGTGLSQTGMQAMISADSSMKQAQIQGNVAARMEGRAGVLKAEIKQDAGGNTEAKEAELAETEQKAASAAASQMNTLADANRIMEEAAKADQSSRTEEEDTRTENKADKNDKTDQEGAAMSKVSADQADGVGCESDTQAQAAPACEALPAVSAAAQANVHTHVDIRL